MRIDDAGAGLVLHALDLAAATVDVAHEVALVFLGRGDFDAHDRLEQNRVGLLHRVLEREDAGHLEREFGRVDLVERTVDDLHDDVDHRETGDDTVVAPSRMPSIAGLMNSFGIEPPTISLMISTPLPFSFGSSLMHDVAVLALAAGLADELALAIGGLGDGLAIGDLRLAGGGLDLELALHAVADDVEVKLAHAGENGLAACPGRS